MSKPLPKITPEIEQHLTQSLIAAAMETNWGKVTPYSVVACALSLGGSALFGTLIPGSLPLLISFGLGGSALAAGVYSSKVEGDLIEAGRSSAILRQLGEDQWARIERSVLLSYPEFAEALGKNTPLSLSSLETQGRPNDQKKGPSHPAEAPSKHPQAAHPQATKTAGTPPSNVGSEQRLIQEKLIELDEAAPHLYLGGRTREGKSETLKFLLADATKVHYLTSKVTDHVPTPWIGYIAVGQHRANIITHVLDIWEERLEGHLEGTYLDPEWFCIDEIVGMMKWLKSKGGETAQLASRMKSFVIEGITAGAAVNAYIALLSQTGNSGPLEIDLDLLKNFSIVSCSKRKRKDMINFYAKLTDYKFNQEQLQQIENLEGYWQLWEDNGEPRLSTFKPQTVAMKPCFTWKDLNKSTSEQDQCPEQRLVSWMNSNIGWHRPYAIKKNVRPFKDEWSKEDFIQLLDRLSDEGVIVRLEGRYASTGTLPS